MAALTQPIDDTRPSAAPVIPPVAWQRPIGLPCPNRSRARVSPMIDDGEWAGVPIGGLGSGSIGPTFRGDVARWHLEVGRHAFRPVAADTFSLFVGRADGSTARVLSALRPAELDSPELPAWGWGLPIGAGTYHALFPRAWWTYEPEAIGVRLVGEQLSPVVGGDYSTSALPVGSVEWWVENPGSEPVTVGLMLSWRNPLGACVDEPAPAGAWAEVVEDGASLGVRFHDGGAGPAGLRGTFAIGVEAVEDLGRAGGPKGRRGAPVELSGRSRFDAVGDAELWADFAADGALETASDPRPAEAGESLGGAVAARVLLAPGESRSIRFAIAWDLPIVEFGAGRRWWKRYTRDWGRSGERAWDLARDTLTSTPAWRAAIQAWQAPIVDDPVRPAWYRAALFNELYFLVDGGTFWEAGEVGGPEPAPDDVGRFALLECLDYRFYDTVDVDFSASAAILELWPELERRGIRDLLAAVAMDDPTPVVTEATGLPAVRKVGGTVPHDVGGPDEDPFVRSNRYIFQDPNVWLDLAPKLALQVWRDVRWLDDVELAHAARPVVEGALRGLALRDTNRDGLPDHRGIPDQTYDTWPMHGSSAYGGLLWLGALRAAEELARLDGDEPSAAAWHAAFDRGRATFETTLWQGAYYAFDSEGPSPGTIMADQLSGQWYADVSALGDLIDPARAAAALRTVFERNVLGFHGGSMGAVNGMLADGTVDRSSEQSEEVWVGTTYSLAALMLGRGMTAEAWQTAGGAARVTYERGLWFRTPEAYDEHGNFRASVYLRPLAIWSIEEALRRATTAERARENA